MAILQKKINFPGKTLKTSIRKFLLINLLLAVGITTALTALGNYYLNQHVIQAHLNRFQNNQIKILRDNIGEKLVNQLFLNDLYMLILVFPISGILIWYIVGRGLASIGNITKEVANREPSHLEPVNLQFVPQEIKPMIDELNKLFYRLQEGFEREKRFAADAAHELRTPLAAIKTQAQVALRTNDMNQKNESLKKLITSVNRTTHIVQQLLTMSRLLPDSPHVTDFEQVNLVRVTRDMLTMLAPKAIEKQIELEFHADIQAPRFLGNSTAICILIRNLVDNAIRYTPNHGQIVVRVSHENNRALLEIADTGPGIPASLHKRVFERFFRVLGHSCSGSGLGLAIVKEIAELHQAQIELDAPHDHSGLIVRIFFSQEALPSD